ncbi:MAG: hypothetical protein H6R14_1408 [Proteobacteria bacterium]|nr:hypothetical protein [Pseudomonadota bacterium]
MKRSLQNMLAVAVFAVTSVVSTAASAVPYFIKFYEADLSAGVDASDLDGDGIADGFGTFEGPAPGSMFVPITSFNATVGGSTWDTLASSSVFPYAPDFFEFNGKSWLRGFVFEDPTDVGSSDRVNVLQLDALGFFSGNSLIGVGLWAVSGCSLNSCGGGRFLGTYEITLGTPVPAPATLPLALLGIAALAAIRRRVA